MGQPQIQFLQIAPTELAAMVASEVKKAIEPIIKQQVQPRNEVRRYTRKQTAGKLCITLTTLWAHTRAGEIESLPIGGRVLYTEAAIEAALRKRRFTAGEGEAK